jgi:hypothetical protein
MDINAIVNEYIAFLKANKRPLALRKYHPDKAVAGGPDLQAVYTQLFSLIDSYYETKPSNADFKSIVMSAIDKHLAANRSKRAENAASRAAYNEIRAAAQREREAAAAAEAARREREAAAAAAEAAAKRARERRPPAAGFGATNESSYPSVKPEFARESFKRSTAGFNTKKSNKPANTAAPSFDPKYARESFKRPTSGFNTKKNTKANKPVNTAAPPFDPKFARESFMRPPPKAEEARAGAGAGAAAMNEENGMGAGAAASAAPTRSNFLVIGIPGIKYYVFDITTDLAQVGENAYSFVYDGNNFEIEYKPGTDTYLLSVITPENELYTFSGRNAIENGFDLTMLDQSTIAYYPGVTEKLEAAYAKDKNFKVNFIQFLRMAPGGDRRKTRKHRK